MQVNIKPLFAFVGVAILVGLATSPVVGVTFAIAASIVIELLMTFGMLGASRKD